MPENQKEKYYSISYDHFPRWASYWHQIRGVLDLMPESVLEVGAGNKIVSDYLKKRNLRVVTLDIDSSLEPDVEASVIDMPFDDNSFDVVLASQILEHLPYEDFIPALKEIKRVSKRYAVISLPRWGRLFLFCLKIPSLPWLRFFWKLPGLKRHVKGKNGHYWEIGKRGLPLCLIRKEIKNSGFDIIKDYVIFEHPYHHFFILHKK